MNRFKRIVNYFYDKKINISIFIFLIGCKSYEERFTIQDYDENSAVIAYSEVKHHEINGLKVRVKQLDFDKFDILKKKFSLGTSLLIKLDTMMKMEFYQRKRFLI